VNYHVRGLVGDLNKKVDILATSIHDLMTQQQYLVADVTRLKGGEGSSRFSRMNKLEFPKFHGDDVQGWMFRAKQFFSIDNVQEDDKIKIVLIHMYDRTLGWNLQFMRNHGDNVTWAVYEKAILKRFWGLDDDPMAELKNLRYETTMKQYQSKFEMILTQVTITEAQSISMYITGLPPAIEMIKSAPLLPTPKSATTYYKKNNPMNARNTTTTLALPTSNTQQVSKYVPGHKYNGQMFTLEVLGNIEESAEGVEEEEFVNCEETRLDSNLYTTKKLGCDIKSTCPLQVSVAGDNKLISQNKVSTFQWVIQGTIQWNFQDLKMQFNYKGRKVCLRDTSQSELSWMNGKQLNKLLGLVYLESYIIYHESLERIVEDDKYLNFKCY
ncbi:hypothetical protein Tco_0846292, partial [Tanacetum coccineum]